MSLSQALNQFAQNLGRYQSKTVIFDAANATSETMKRRGRKKAE